MKSVPRVRRIETGGRVGLLRLAAVCSAVVACGGPSDEASQHGLAVAVAVADDRVPNAGSAGDTRLARSSQPADVAAAKWPVEAGSDVPSTTIAPSSVTVSEEAVDLIRIEGPIRTITFLGDSLTAELRGFIPDDRLNIAVPTLAAELKAHPAFAGASLVNKAIPGVSVARTNDVITKNLAWAIGEFVVAADPRADLVLIQTSRIDLDTIEPVSDEELVAEVVDALRQAVASLEEIGVQAIVIPAFPIDLQANWLLHAGGKTGMNEARDIGARLDRLNRALQESDLPVLPDFDLDADSVPGPDPHHFVRRSGELRDGIHLGPTGEIAFGEQVAEGIRKLVRVDHPNVPQHGATGQR